MRPAATYRAARRNAARAAMDALKAKGAPRNWRLIWASALEFHALGRFARKVSGGDAA